MPRRADPSFAAYQKPAEETGEAGDQKPRGSEKLQEGLSQHRADRAEPIPRRRVRGLMIEPSRVPGGVGQD